jgi:hypothetical protein
LNQLGYSNDGNFFELFQDWNAATHGTINVTVEEHGKMILPLMLQVLTPPVSYL